ncbi:multifunctional dye peroxidase DyP2-like [Corticium candelabrum]|uniref:multifunctional dye peroxidase DyP2-like n=1 Tax=Corticium candelabrum TaxID=121492 RepID=UPI002E269D2D|nr:multifunctional dye peroxidase DyP2-like [Corticium candelabrum]
MAYRRLEQDVDLFRFYGKIIQKRLRLRGINVSQEEAEARMLGRRKNGEPLVHNLSGIKPDDRDKAINFNYNDDRDGAQCPLASHIRKVNPRGSSVAGPNDYKKNIVRRTILYGNKLKREPVGLLFLCYQSALDQGFLVQQFGSNSETFGESPPPRVGLDMVIGQRVFIRHLLSATNR